MVDEILKNYGINKEVAAVWLSGACPRTKKPNNLVFTGALALVETHIPELVVA